MSPTITALLVYILWMLLLLGMIAGLRTAASLSGEKKANDFNPDGSDVSDFSNRLCRAHANCFESFPIFGGLMLLAIATDTMQITNGLAFIMIGARLLQSGVHLISTSENAVMARFAFFLVQVAIALYWSVMLFKAFM